MDKKIGNYAFIIGVIIAVVLGLAESSLGAAGPWLVSLMVLLGLVVGFMNVGGKESKDFLLVAVALVIVVSIGAGSDVLSGVQYIGSYLAAVLKQIMAFVMPATIIVGLKYLWATAEKA